jgi:hypothetical protein
MAEASLEHINEFAGAIVVKGGRRDGSAETRVTIGR